MLYLLTIGVAIVAAAFTNPFKVTSSEIIYHTISIDEAIVKAKLEDKNIFVKYEAEWCLPCQIMDESIFSEDNIISILNENYITIVADKDIPEDSSWFTSYEVCCLPTVGIVDDSKIQIDKLEGTSDISEFKAFLKKNVKSKMVVPAQYEIVIDEPIISDARFRVIQFGAFSNLQNAEKLKAKLEIILNVPLIIHEDTEAIYKVLHAQEISEFDFTAIKDKARENNISFFVKKQ